MDQTTAGESRKRVLLIAIAIACGALAMVLLYSYLGAEKQKYNQQVEAMKRQQAEARAAAAAQNVVSVLIAARPLQAGAQITMADLAAQNIPLEYAQPGAINANSNIIGMVAAVAIGQGEQILQSKISQYEKPKLVSDMTPPGKRAVPVVIENFNSVASMLKPGDNVDIMASVSPPESSPLSGSKSQKTVTLPLFQNVLVLLVGNSERKSPNDVPTGNSITLALTPQETSLVEFVQEQGTIRAVMRSNADLEAAPVQVADWDSLFEYLYPDQKGRLTRKPTVEIYRGLQKETVPLAEGKKQ